jgi:hypothetical protein
MSWIHVLGSTGVVNSLLAVLVGIRTPLRLLYTDFSIYMGLVHALLPFMVLNIFVSLYQRLVGKDEHEAVRTAREYLAAAAVVPPPRGVIRANSAGPFAALTAVVCAHSLRLAAGRACWGRAAVANVAL